MSFRTAVVCLCVYLGFTLSINPAVAADSPDKKIEPALKSLDANITASMASTKVPGLSVAVVYHDKVVFLKGYGVRKLGEPDPVDADTIFELASLSKPL